ncbi:hypothetical protein HN911_13345 [Candidatus Bathyarchaeota archaeon]|jgi:hypothetical protein|nr:hypothetical protein [Candidatus Bathyarchaeota archaeon]
MSKKIEAAIAANAEALMAKLNVVAVGEAEKEKNGRKTGKRGLTIYVEGKVPKDQIAAKDLIPRTVDGVKTDVVILERAKALPLHEGFEDRFDGWRRPYLMGDEIGPTYHNQCGTLGMIFRAYGQDLGLTNWHVLHASDDEGQDIKNHHVSQPGWKKAGQPEPTFIGVVEAHSTLDPSTLYNKVDAAVLSLEKPGGNAEKPNPGWNAPGSFWDRHLDTIANRGYFSEAGGAPLLGWPHYHKNFAALVRDIKEPSGCRPQPHGLGTVDIGDRVWKSGRTTGVTSGTVIATNFNAGVSYGGKLGTVRFTQQIMVRPDPALGDPELIVAGGDSGSLVIDETGNAVGLLFAGSSSYFIANIIQNVFELVLPGIEKIYNLNREALL